jgi:uncharacterized membrane protein YfcA
MVSWITLPVATVLGFLAGLGVGGGSLLMLWLTLAVGMEYEQARIMNLLFFLPSAIIATLFHRKQGSVRIKKILPGILAGCVAAALFSYIGNRIDTTILRKCFGGLLLVTGVRELFYRPRKPR